MPTKTVNKIHFEDLEPKRFEDLCMMLLYRHRAWDSINHYGRAGNDNGIDILAEEKLENGDKRTWYIQCKRYNKITKKDLKNVVDKICNERKIDVLLTIVGCDPQKATHEYYAEYAKKRGVSEPKLWTASYLESLLYHNCHDLLFAFFDISLAAQTKTKESLVKRNIVLKKQMQRDFIVNNNKGYTSEQLREVRYNPSKKFISEEVIIHSIDDIDYPHADSFSNGISSWFRAGLYDFYFNGIELRSHYQGGVINSSGEWAILSGQTESEQLKKEGYSEILIIPCMRIPFKNIITYDIEGDEYYNYPHIYCRYSEGGSPYEKIIYRLFKEKEYPMELDEKKRLNLKIP